MALLSFLSCSSQQFVIEPQFDAVKCFSEGYAAVKRNGLWGYIDTKGALIVKPQFKEADEVKDNLALVKLLSGERKYIHIHADGFEFAEEKMVAIPLIFETGTGQYFSTKVNGLYNLVGPGKKEIFPHQFDSIIYIGEGLFVASEYGEGDFLIDTKGRILFHEVLGEIIPEINRGRIQYRGDDKSGMLDTSGNILMQKKYWRFEFAGNLIACTEGGKLGLITNSGEKISENIYDEMIPLSNETFMALITDTGFGKIYDNNGKIIVSDFYAGDGRIKFGLLPSKDKTDKFGYVNERGEVQIPFSFYYTTTFFDNGTAVFGQRDSDGNYTVGLLDTAGKIVLPAIYQQIFFTQDVYTVIRDDAFQLLANDLQALTEPSKDPIEYLGNGLYAIYIMKTKLVYNDGSIWSGTKGGFAWEKEGKVKGIYDLSGNTIVEGDDYNPDEKLPVCSEGIMAVKRKGKWGFISVSEK